MMGKKRIKPLCLLLITLLMLPVFGGCNRQKAQLDKVTLCEVTHSIFYAPQYIAINQGFFEQEGIEVELSNGQGADKVMAAVVSGNVDIGFAGPEAAIYVYNEGRENYAQVFAQLTRRDGSFLVGREADEDFTWSKLEGKTLLPGRKGGVPYMTLEYVLKQKGLQPGVDVILDDSIQFALMAGAFTGGTGDYVALFEPTASMMEAEGKGYILDSIGAQTEEIPYTAYFASKEFIEKNQDLIQRFVNAVYKGQRWMAEHTPAEIAQALLPSFPDTEKELIETVVKRYQEIGVWNETPVMEQQSFELLQQVMTQAGELTQTAPFELVVNNQFSKQAVAQIQDEK